MAKKSTPIRVHIWRTKRKGDDVMNTTTTPDIRERVLAFRVTFHDLDTLKRKARKEGTTVSTVIRKALELEGRN